ncbi:MAG: hypothetical protein ACT4PP_11795 [Sporichthyaceae bacterium]
MSTPDDLSIETLADYAEGLLGEAETAAVEALLATSPQARADLELLASVTAILACDEVGAMPAEYAARIDATLAELARTAPVVPVTAPLAATPALAPVVDLASRRREVWAGARRVGSVAASLVLVIGGAAIGVQVLSDDGTEPPPSAAGPVTTETQTVSLERYVPRQAPKRAVKGKDGSKIDKKTGIVFLKNGEVLHPDGTVVKPGKKDGAPTTIVLGPGLTAEKGTKSKPSDRVQTAIPPRAPAPVAPAEQATIASAPDAEPETSAAPSAPSSAVATPSPGTPGTDPYVGTTETEYTPDNFAALVRILLEEAGEYAPAGTTSAANDPALPAQQSTTVSSRNRPASGTLRSDAGMRPVRGPASPELQERVRRCAAQLNTSALAGDAGTWKGKAATIVVVPNPDSDTQVIGYVFYGECSVTEPVTAKDAQWVQPVSKPAAPIPAPAPAPSPSTAPATESVSRTGEQ